MPPLTGQLVSLETVTEAIKEYLRIIHWTVHIFSPEIQARYSYSLMNEELHVNLEYNQFI